MLPILFLKLKMQTLLAMEIVGPMTPIVNTMHQYCVKSLTSIDQHDYVVYVCLWVFFKLTSKENKLRPILSAGRQ